jgi:DNA repair protein RecO (recombination protein O)
VLYKTRGIVFRYVKYGETSIIVTIFTELFGLQSYIIHGVRSHSRTAKMALFQPLTLLELVVYHKESGAITRIKEVKCWHPFQTLGADVRKSAIALFMNEVMNKAVKEQSHVQPIYDFLSRSLVLLDRSERVENFHLSFLLGLSKYLGFGADQAAEMLSGLLVSKNEEAILQQLLTSPEEPIKLTYVQRQNLLTILLRFYAHHIDHFGEVKSVAVLREVLG